MPANIAYDCHIIRTSMCGKILVGLVMSRVYQNSASNSVINLYIISKGGSIILTLDIQWGWEE